MLPLDLLLFPLKERRLSVQHDASAVSVEVETPAPAAVQPDAPAEVVTETPAPLAVQPDASA
eukprot:6071724-Pleurochrysis_carterae.AAC.1